MRTLSPNLPDAADCQNVRFFREGQEREKTKRVFTKGLWSQNFDRFWLLGCRWLKLPFSVGYCAARDYLFD